jgi:hypothetical protein
VVIWVLGAGAAVLVAALAVVVRLAIRRWRARRALERSFQREWFGLARWAPLASGEEAPSAPYEKPAEPVAESWYYEETQPVAVMVDSPPAHEHELEPWPPSGHEEWVALLSDQQPEAPADYAPPEGPPAVALPVPPAADYALPEELPATPDSGLPEPAPHEASPATDLATLAAQLAPTPQFAPLAAELASLAAEIAALAETSQRLDAPGSAQ